MGKASKKKKQQSPLQPAGKVPRVRESLDIPRFLKIIFDRPIIQLLLIAMIGLLAYSNTFNVPFLFDDAWNIKENPLIKNLDNFFSNSSAYNNNPRRFIGYLTFALNYHFGKLDVTGYHVVNLAIHIMNAILVYFLVILTFKRPFLEPQRHRDAEQDREKIGQKNFNPPLPPLELRGDEGGLSRFTTHVSRFIALFSALLFVSHPIQTQAVTYIVQRFTSLATMFYLLSVVFYIKGRLTILQTGKPTSSVSALAPTLTFFFLSLVSAILAMRTKEIAFTLPIVILLYEFMFFETSLKKKFIFLLPILLTLMIIPLSIMGTDKPLGEVLSDMSEKARVQAEGSRWVYFFTQMRVITTYIRLVFLPINQNLDYDYPIYHSLFAPPVFLSFLFLLSLLGLACYLLYRSRSGKEQRATGIAQRTEGSPLNPPSARGEVNDSRFTIHLSRLAAFGIFWFFATLSVESSIIPIADVIFEHRVYLPSTVFFIALTIFVFIFADRFKVRPKTVVSVLSVIIAVLSIATYMRNNVWRSPISLWEDVTRKSPDNARPYFNLGNEYALLGDYEKAVLMYRKSLEVEPKAYIVSDERTRVYTNLGSAYGNLGKYDEAIDIFVKILRENPDALDARNNLAAAYINTERYAQAIEPLKRVIEKKPDFIDAHYNLALAYHMTGDRANAIKEYEILKQLSPKDASELIEIIRK